MITRGYTQFKMSFEICPVILTGGIAAAMPGGMIPIISITDSVNFVDGILSFGDELLGLNDFFAEFVPLPGASLIDNTFGQYPFANQSVAANARIKNPLVISLRMITTARGEGGYATKLATMQSLKATLDQHDASGGTYTVATPSYIFANCVSLGLRDTSNTASNQPQNAWQWDFWQPLLTLNDAAMAQGGLMAQISSGAPLMSEDTSGLAAITGNPSSVGAPGLVPAATAPTGASSANPFYSETQFQND